MKTLLLVLAALSLTSCASMITPQCGPQEQVCQGSCLPLNETCRDREPYAAYKAQFGSPSYQPYHGRR